MQLLDGCEIQTNLGDDHVPCCIAEPLCCVLLLLLLFLSMQLFDEKDGREMCFMRWVLFAPLL
jgi:hypothetical protein